MNLLWSDRGEDQARNSLRQTLSVLKKALEVIDPLPLQIDRTTVSVLAESIEMDTLELENSNATTDVINLYRGEFLEGIVVRDPSGEEWLTSERDRYRRMAVEALEKLLTRQREDGEMDAAVETGERLVGFDPLRESAWRQLMLVYATRGERGQALKAYTRCTGILEKEYGIEPEQETIELQTAIHDGRFDIAVTDIQPEQVISIEHASAVTNEISVPSSSEKPTIAVLPFTNMSGDPEQEYFSEGITEDIITELTRFLSLFVIARNSSFAFKGQAIDITEIGKKLGVQFVVEGSVRKAGERIRITAQLIEASTGNHLWAERYDRNLDDIFAVQDEVASQIATVIPGHVDIANRIQAERKPAMDMNAYELVLRAENILNRNFGSREGEQLLKQALEIDPEYARAHATLAEFYAYSVFAHALDVDEATTLARTHAETALKIDPGDAVVQASSAVAYLEVGEYALASHHMDKAIALNPNDHVVMSAAAEVKAYLGEYDAAVEWANKASLCDPFSWDSRREAYFDAHFLGGQYELALEQFVGWQDLPLHNYLSQAAAFAQLDRLEEAKDALQQFEKNRPEDWSTVDVLHAYVRMCAKPEDGERWLEGFRKAGLEV
jgi:TolB-like protein